MHPDGALPSPAFITCSQSPSGIGSAQSPAPRGLVCKGLPAWGTARLAIPFAPIAEVCDTWTPRLSLLRGGGGDCLCSAPANGTGASASYGVTRLSAALHPVRCVRTSLSHPYHPFSCGRSIGPGDSLRRTGLFPRLHCLHERVPNGCAQGSGLARGEEADAHWDCRGRPGQMPPIPRQRMRHLRQCLSPSCA